MKLYGFFRSSASYRVRIALNMKGLEYSQMSVHLTKGQQNSEKFIAVNPQKLVPVIEIGDDFLFQSMAILDYLELTYPDKPILPKDVLGQVRVRSIAQMVACDIHPLNNVRVLNYLSNQLDVTNEQKLKWYHHWIRSGFEALETRLKTEPQTGQFCHGDEPGYADLVLVPQVANATRFDVDLNMYPTLMKINDRCLDLPAFRKAMPENQPDVE